MKSLDRINNFIIEHASGRTVLALMVVTIVSFYLMAGVITPAFQEATNGLRPFDLNFGISAEMIYRDLPSYTDRSRTLYLWFALADYVYPAAGAAFFAFLWAWMFSKVNKPVYPRLVAGGILLFPFLFALIDWLENAGFLFVMFRYPAEHVTIANLAGTLKKIKPFVEAVIIILTLVFTVTTVWQRRSQRRLQGGKPPPIPGQ
jgi:hypothetical protein